MFKSPKGLFEKYASAGIWTQNQSCTWWLLFPWATEYLQRILTLPLIYFEGGVSATTYEVEGTHTRFKAPANLGRNLPSLHKYQSRCVQATSCFTFTFIVQVTSSTGNCYPLYDDSGSKHGVVVCYYGKVKLWSGRIGECSNHLKVCLKKMPQLGFEPRTNNLHDDCSTVELVSTCRES